MKAIKFVAYAILSVCLIYFGKNLYSEYNRVTEQSAARAMELDAEDIDTPDYQVSNPEPVVLESETPGEEQAPTPVEVDMIPDPEGDQDPATLPETNPEISDVEADNAATSPSEVSNRLGFHGGGFVMTLLIFGILTAYDITRYFSNRAMNALYNDDGGGTPDNDLYESAEQEWVRGDYLEAIRILRDYLKANPRQQHAAIRIAEIYEKDLKNPLAAALEYEEILTQKLSADRWGWTAVHLANLYSGPMDKPEKAVELLRQLVETYPETAAAEKAAQRLALIDGEA
jgi:TolA-binding protein